MTFAVVTKSFDHKLKEIKIFAEGFLKVLQMHSTAISTTCLNRYYQPKLFNTIHKNSQIQDQARHCFHYQKKTYEQVVELKDVLITRQFMGEKQFDVSKYTRWQQLKVGLTSVKHQNININCKNRNEIFRQPR